MTHFKAQFDAVGIGFTHLGNLLTGAHALVDTHQNLGGVAVDGNKRRVAFARESNVVPYDEKLAVPRSIGAHVLHRTV